VLGAAPFNVFIHDLELEVSGEAASVLLSREVKRKAVHQQNGEKGRQKNIVLQANKQRYREPNSFKRPYLEV